MNTKIFPKITFPVCLLIICVLSSCSLSSDRTVSMTWEKQFSIMKESITGIDEDTVLKYGVASPVANGSPDGSLSNSFTFVRSDGTLIEITFLDNNIRNSLKVNQHLGQDNNPPDLSERRRLRDALSFVQISSVEALNKTITQGKAYAEQNQVTLTPLLRLDLDINIQKRFGIPASWIVLFPAKTRALRLWINANDGMILKAEEIDYT